MFAAKLRGRITRDGKLIVEVPRDMTAGEVEVILLRATDRPPKRRPRDGSAHPAFGIWAGRTDIADSGSFAARLRQRVETRSDGDA
jgi:hypothetical protein